MEYHDYQQEREDLMRLYDELHICDIVYRSFKYGNSPNTDSRTDLRDEIIMLHETYLELYDDNEERLVRLDASLEVLGNRIKEINYRLDQEIFKTNDNLDF